MVENRLPSSTASVVVAVDGSEGSLAAVRYGAHEAVHVGCDLTIVHVAPTYLPLAGLAPMGGAVAVTEFEAVGREILEESAKPAYSVLPRDRVTPMLELGNRTSGVLDAARDARLLVVGNERAPLLARLAIGRFSATIAARAPVPVVSVPKDWALGAGDGRVVLAIKDPQRIPLELLRGGFQAAADHGAALEIVHVWDLPTGYGALVTSLTEDSSGPTMIERSVRRLVAPLRAEFPDVSFTAISEYGRPPEILLERAQRADLLVLARRAHGFPLGHFGETGKALLRQAACPVEVLPVAETTSPSAAAVQPTVERQPEAAATPR